MLQRCFALPYYVYCLRLRCLVSFLFYSTIFDTPRYGIVALLKEGGGKPKIRCPVCFVPSAVC
ncbi:Uncharacterised protein [Neisseria animalis]|nr:Uncharacterised protein [Neisseria animalis]